MNFSAKRFGEFFHSLRDESGLSMAQMADKTGLATTTIFSIEQGDGRLSLDQLFRVAKVFGIQPDIMLAKFVRRQRALAGHARAKRHGSNGNEKAAAQAAT